MASGLVDSNVLIDLLRAYPPALTWIASQSWLGVSYVVYLELLEGTQDRRGEQKALKLINEFELIETMHSDFVWSVEKMLKFHLSHHVSYADCMIAATAYRLQLPLYTQNVKHFQPLLGALATKPY